MIDLSKLLKGAKVRLKDGRVVTVSGMYLSGGGPCLMVREGSATVNQNVPIEDVQEILEG